MANNNKNWLITLAVIFLSSISVVLALICIYSTPDRVPRPLAGLGFFSGGVAIALICIYSLPDNTSRPMVGALYFMGSAVVIGNYIFLTCRTLIAERE